MKVMVDIKTLYGDTTIYPACPRSESFARIAGTKTLTWEMLKDIRALGYDIVNTAPPLGKLD